MKQKLKKYSNLILLCISFLLLPFNWFKEVPIKDKLGTYIDMSGNASGMYAMCFDSCRILMIYLLCIGIQYLTLKQPKKAWISAISQLILVAAITFFPAFVAGGVYLFCYFGMFSWKYYDWIYFFVIGILLLSVVKNVIDMILAFRKGKLN